MKIKFEIKSSDNQVNPLFTIFLEHKGKDTAEIFITKFNVRQLKMGDSPTMESQNTPLDDGKIIINKEQVKEFIASLQLLVKTFKSPKK